jgi:predicted RND superfamily exporter protein
LPRVTKAIRSGLGLVAMWCFRHAWLTLLLLGFVAAAAASGAARLKLDPDITRLLPSSYGSVRDVESLRERFGGVGNVVLLVRGGSAEARRSFADRISKELEGLPTVRSVDAKLPLEFFEDRALYFLDRSDLETVADRLEARRRYELSRAQLDLDDSPPPPVELDHLRTKYEARIREASGVGGVRSAYHESERELALFVRPTELASNLDFARRVVADVEGVLARHPPASFDPHLTVDLTGRYKKRVDLQAVLGRDLALTSVLASLLVLAYVALHFRRLSAAILVTLPLALGLELAYGVAGVAFGTLNVLTAFIGAILLGIGIDNGIHLLGRYHEIRRVVSDPERAIFEAFGETGRVTLAAALTTATAFGGLAFSDFLAFRQFGALAASGVLLVLFSYLTLLPALLGLGTRYLPSLVEGRSRELRLPGVPRLRRAAPVLLFAAGALGLMLASRAPALVFNADFAALDRAPLPSFQLDAEVTKLLGHSQTPLVFLADDDAHARAVAAKLRQRSSELGSRAVIGNVLALPDLVPEGQSEKVEVVDRIRRAMARMPLDALEPKERERAERLSRMAEARPFTAKDLPRSVSDLFASKADDGAPGAFVLAYPTVSMSDGPAVRELSRQLRHVEVEHGRPLSAAGEPMVLADILDVVTRDVPRVLSITTLLVTLCLWLTAGSLGAALLALAPAVGTFVVTAGLLPVLGLELNYLNMIILPILLGIGVDDGLHVVTRVSEGEPLEVVWSNTGWNIFGAILTDIFGFGVLAFAEHPGLASFGKVAVVGLLVNLVACVIVLPAFLAVRNARREVKNARRDVADSRPRFREGV